jgi:hypothetical protein
MGLDLTKKKGWQMDEPKKKWEPTKKMVKKSHRRQIMIKTKLNY